MPLTTIILPNGKKIPVTDLIKKGKPFLPMAVLLIIDSELKQAENPFRGSSLAGCPCKAYLKLNNDYSKTLESVYISSFRGAFIHSLFEYARKHEEGILSEVRLSTKLNDIELTCKPDLYHIKLQELEDYKTVKGISPIWAPYDEHIKQFEIYRFILEANGYPVKQTNITYISMNDWMQCLMRDDKPSKLTYPNKGGWKTTKNDKRMRPRDEIVEWLANKTQHIKTCIEKKILPETEPGGLCDGSNRTGTIYCEVQHLCPVYNPNFDELETEDKTTFEPDDIGAK